MPEWLIAVLASVMLSVVGQALLYIGMVKIAGVRLDDHDRRLDNIETEKVDQDVYDEHAKRVDGDILSVAEGVRSAGHRMNGLDQRITSESERTERNRAN